MSRRMGLDPSMPSLWERGKRLVPRSRVPALAAALEVSVEELRGQAPDTEIDCQRLAASMLSVTLFFAEAHTCDN